MSKSYIFKLGNKPKTQRSLPEWASKHPRQHKLTNCSVEPEGASQQNAAWHTFLPSSCTPGPPRAEEKHGKDPQHPRVPAWHWPESRAEKRTMFQLRRQRKHTVTLFLTGIRWGAVSHLQRAAGKRRWRSITHRSNNNGKILQLVLATWPPW